MQPGTENVLHLLEREQEFNSGDWLVHGAGLPEITPTNHLQGEGASLHEILEGIITWAGAGAGGLTGAVILAPTASTRNVVQPTAADIVALTLKSFAGQTAKHLRGVSDTDVEQWSIGPGGAAVFSALTLGALSGILKASAGVVSGGAGVGDLAGVSLSSLASGQYLRHNGTAWVNTAIVASDIAHNSLSGLTTGDPHSQYLLKAGGTMTGALVLSGDPTLALHAATKQYVDAAAAGIQTKTPARVATTANITLSGLQTIGGISLIAGDRVVAKDQFTASENGIYVVAAGAWSRAADMDADSEVPGALVYISEGTPHGGQQWQVTTAAPITLGSTSITWTLFFSPQEIIAGAGLTKSGTTIDAVGTANRIQVNADSIDISASYVGQATITTLGTIGTGAWQGTPVGAVYGGTGQSSWTLGDLLYSSASNTLAKLAGSTSSSKRFLTQTGNGTISAAPAWGTIATGDLPTIPISGGGTGQTSQTAAFDALSPATTLGDTLYHNGTDNVRLAGNTTATKMFLRQTGNGTISAAPAWDTLVDGDIPATLVRTSRSISTTSPLAGGGDLSANRTLSIGGLSSLGTANQIPGTNAAATGWEYKTVSGTANRVTVTHGVGTITLSGPQDIHSGASPTFVRATLSQATGTAPLTVSSTTVVANLNADLLDGQEGSFYQSASNINAGTLATARGGTGLGAIGTANQILGVNAGATGLEFKSVSSANSNRVTVTHAANSVSLSGPQDIHTAASPTFAGVTVTGLSASLPVFSNGSDALVSNAMTGTGSVVMSASPTLTGTITAAAATLSGEFRASSAVIGDYAAPLSGRRLTSRSSSANAFVSIDSPTGATSSVLELLKAGGATGSGSIYYDGGSNEVRIMNNGGDGLRVDNSRNVFIPAGWLNVGSGTFAGYEGLLVERNGSAGSIVRIRGNANGGSTFFALGLINTDTPLAGETFQEVAMLFKINGFEGGVPDEKSAAMIRAGKSNDFMSTANIDGYLSFHTTLNASLNEAGRFSSVGHFGVGTATPGSLLSYSIGGTNKVIHVDSTDVGALIAEGTNAGQLWLVDTGATADQRWMIISSDSGYTKFLPHSDSGSVLRTAMTIGHGTGFVGISITPLSGLDVAASAAFNLTEYSTAGTVGLDGTMFSIVCTQSAASGTRTLNLPLASSCPRRIYVINRFGSGPVTIARAGSDTIEFDAGSHTSVTLTHTSFSGLAVIGVTLQSDGGTKWRVIGTNAI